MEPLEIKKLEESVINKIAAGEIIQRPGNCLKELLENRIIKKMRFVFNATKNLFLLSSGGVLVPKIDQSGHDTLDPNIKTVRDFYNRRPSNETGWDRLKQMFTLDEFGVISPELNSCYQAGYLGFIIGAFYGGVINSRTVYVNFMENNMATAYKSHLDAKRKLQDDFTVNFAKGAFRWGWRLSFFTISYVGITTVISTYRNKSSLWEYLAAGAFAGFMYKIPLGPRGMVAGGIIGGVFGGIAGGCSLLLMRATGTSTEEMRYWQYKWKLDRDNSVKQAFDKQRDPKTEMMKLHDEKVGEEISLDALE